MGMYTELYFRAGLKEDTPNCVISVLKDMCKGKAITAPFGEGRCRYLFNISSHYHFPFAVAKMKYLDYVGRWYLFVRSDIKNYEGEIEAFLSWVKPYLDCEEGDYVGHIFYEEWTKPRNLFFGQSELSMDNS